MAPTVVFHELRAVLICDVGTLRDGAAHQLAAANVIAKEIAAEVAAGIAPDGVDVVDIVLSVVVLDEERRALEPVVMRTPRPVFSRPCEVDVVDPRPLDPIPFDGRERFGQPL